VNPYSVTTIARSMVVWRYVSVIWRPTRLAHCTVDALDQIIDDVTGGKFRISPREKSGSDGRPGGRLTEYTPNIRLQPTVTPPRRRKIVERGWEGSPHPARSRKLLDFGRRLPERRRKSNARR